MLLVALGAAAVATSDVQPTGDGRADLTYAVIGGGAVTAAASQSRRWTWGVSCLALLWLVPSWPMRLMAAAAVAVSVASMARGRRRDVGALVGVVAAYLASRLDSVDWPDVISFQGSSAAVALLVLSPILVSGYLNSSEPRQKFVARIIGMVVVLSIGAALLVAVVAILAIGPFSDGIDSTRDGFDAASDGDDEAAIEQFQSAQSQLLDASRLLTGPWMLPARFVPGLAQHVEVVQVATDESVALTATAEAAARAIEFDDFRVQDGRIDVSLIDAAEPVLAQVHQSLIGARQRITDARSPWHVGLLNDEIDSFIDEIDEVVPSAEIAALAAREAPAMLGANGPVRWLVLATNPAEARGLGGSASNVVTIVIDNGTIQLEQSLRSDDLNALLETNNATLSASAAYTSRWAQYRPERFFQNVTSSPHLPDSAAVAADLFGQATGNPIDGVLVIDPFALAGLLDLTGPVSVGDTRFTGENAADFLLREQYVAFADDEVARVVTLAALFDTTFRQLIQGALPAPKALGEAMGPYVHEGRLGAWWKAGGGAADLLDRAGLDQTFPDRGNGDLISVVHQNQGQNKIDVFLDRNIRYERTSRPGADDPSDVTGTLTATFTNTAPVEGLPLSIIGNDQGLALGTNRLQVSFYSSLTPQAMTVNGVDTAVSAQEEFGLHVVSTSLDIPSGASVDVVVTVGGLAPADAGLTIVNQPLVNDDSLEVIVDGIQQFDLDPSPVDSPGRAQDRVIQVG